MGDVIQNETSQNFRFLEVGISENDVYMHVHAHHLALGIYFSIFVKNYTDLTFSEVEAKEVSKFAGVYSVRSGELK